jgi:hypothetical protein
MSITKIKVNADIGSDIWQMTTWFFLLEKTAPA